MERTSSISRHEGVMVCRTPRRFKIAPTITAVPWQEIHSLVEV
jgi:hypothetical protein